MRTGLTAILAMFLLAPVPAQPDAPEPGASSGPADIQGLLAWYDARSLYEGHRNRDRVQRWPDASGNGHDLTEEGQGLGSVFRTVEADERPVVEVGKGSSFAVANPFALDDHTIFVVYRTGKATLGLFSAARNEQLGVVLAKDAKEHVIHSGPRDAPYNDGKAVGAAPADFSIAVLAREGGRLSAWADGRDISGTSADATTLEVGRLFRVALSRAVTRDAAGLRLAELIFYSRRLNDAERDGLTAQLMDKYGLQPQEPPPAPDVPPPPAFDWSNAEPQASLTTSSKSNLNVPGIAITWDAPLRMAEPFRFDPAQPTRLYCDRDARVHLSVRLRLAATAADTRLRILVLRNDDDYRLQEETVTEADPQAPGAGLVGRVDLSLAMSAGDSVEVVVSRDGAEGEITPLAGESRLLAVAE